MEGITLPTFPTVDLTAGIQWFVNGGTKMVTDNAGVVIMGAIALAGIGAAVAYAKKFAKRNVKG